MNKYIKIILLFAFSNCYAGVGLETTRVIFDENKARTSLVAFNSGEKTNYLVQSWIESEDGVIIDDFITTPPLQKVNAMSKNSIDVIKIKPISGSEEKLYWANFKFIPPMDKNSENQLAISVIHRIKLIHRPSELKNINFSDVMQKLSSNKNGEYLSIKNNTGVYINIASITQGNRDLEKISYIKPNEEVNIKLINSDKVTLHYINDLGSISSFEIQ